MGRIKGEHRMIRKTSDKYGRKIRVLDGFRPYRLYIHHKSGARWGYYVTPSLTPFISEMVEINGEYWFTTLADLREALDIASN